MARILSRRRRTPLDVRKHWHHLGIELRLAKPVALERCPARRRRLPILADQEYLPVTLPGARVVPLETLASACVGFAATRDAAWRLLRWLLLDIDVAVVRGRRHERCVDRRALRVILDRKDAALRALSQPFYWRDPDSMGDRHVIALGPERAVLRASNKRTCVTEHPELMRESINVYQSRNRL